MRIRALVWLFMISLIIAGCVPITPGQVEATRTTYAAQLQATLRNIDGVIQVRSYGVENTARGEWLVTADLLVLPDNDIDAVANRVMQLAEGIVWRGNITVQGSFEHGQDRYTLTGSITRQRDLVQRQSNLTPVTGN